MGMSATAESIDVRITGDASGATGAMTRVGEAVSGAVTVMQQKLVRSAMARTISDADTTPKLPPDLTGDGMHKALHSVYGRRG
jgi:hypothetical protein